MNKQLKWKNIWELPLKYDKMFYCFSSNNIMAITFDYSISKELAQAITDVINGEDKEIKLSDMYIDGADFYSKDYDSLIFSVRGWGHLTGTGGLNLKEKEAIKVQDEFIKYIYQRLYENLTPKSK